MPLTTEQLREALGLIDTMISCNARLQGNKQDDRWRAHLESSIATCSEKIQAYLDGAEPAPRQQRNENLEGAAPAPVRCVPEAFRFPTGAERRS
jgi:hypothetical protein